MSSGVSYIPLESPIEVLEGGIDAYALNNLEDADPMYIGKAAPDARWLVQKYTGGAMTYAVLSNNPGVPDYATAWAGRAGLITKRWARRCGLFCLQTQTSRGLWANWFRMERAVAGSHWLSSWH